MSKYFTLLCFTLLSKQSIAQLSIHENPSSLELVNTIVGDSAQIAISNIKKIGNQKSFGIFKSKFKHTTFIEEGIIITNGLASNAIGPNNSPNKTSKINFISDQDILAIGNNKTSFDTAYLEFDLISKTDQIEFNFSFASEEYPEYVNKNVNDTFIFLLTNLSTGKSKNLALLNNNPSTPISVDNINHINNQSFYISNPELDRNNLAKYKDDMSMLELSYYLQYDGLTTILNVKTTVTANNKYRLKMVISDVGDQLYDSAIFIEANSLRSSGNFPSFNQQLVNLKSGSLIKNYNIHFKIASSIIEGEYSFKTLNELAKILTAKKHLKIIITGHTDSTGTENYNKNLSLSRAIAIKSYLAKKGIASSRIQTEGKGFSMPISHIKKENRRVEITFNATNN